jgi:hypothetical protein
LLIGEKGSVRSRVLRLLGATFLFAAAIAVWCIVFSLAGMERPGGSSPVGIILGLIAAVIILFEMALWLRKYLRGWRHIFPTRTWMLLHIWLGLLSLPLAVCHSGVRFGGLLTSALLIVFLIVIASGVWGLLMQQFLPQKLLDHFPMETIESEIGPMMKYHIEPIRLQVEEFGKNDPRRQLFEQEVERYLEYGRYSGSVLVSASRAAELFGEMLAAYPDDPLLYRLRELCDARREYDSQARVHFWLHNWLWLHLPFSVLLCVLLAVHIITALRYYW